MVAAHKYFYFCIHQSHHGCIVSASDRGLLIQLHYQYTSAIKNKKLSNIMYNYFQIFLQQPQQENTVGIGLRVIHVVLEFKSLIGEVNIKIQQ